MSDRDLALRIAGVLRAGVFVASALAIAGGLALLAREGGAMADFREFVPGADGLRRVSGIVRGALGGDSRAVMQLGVLVMIATPIARVAVSVAHFARERDRTFAWLTGAVLAMLAGGLLLGR